MLKQLKRVKWYLVPISLLFGVLPLMLHLSYFQLDPIYQTVLLNDTYQDFFFFYKGIFFIFLTIVMLITLLVQRDKFPLCRNRYFKIYGLAGLTFIIFSILSTFLSPYKDLAIVGGPTRYEGLGIMLCYIMVMFYCYATIQEFSDYKYILYPFCCTAIVQAITGFTQLIGRDFSKWKFIRDLLAPGEFEAMNYFSPGTEPWFPQTAPIWQGTLGNSNYSGSFISLALPLFLFFLCLAKSTKQRMLLILSTVCTLFVTFACNSRAGLLGLGLSGVFFVICINPSAPILFSKAKAYIHEHFKRTLLIVSAIILLLILFIGTTNVKTRFSLLLKDMVKFINPITVAQTFTPVDTTKLQYIETTTHSIQLQTVSGSLDICFYQGKPLFTNHLGQKLFPLTVEENSSIIYTLYTPPYNGYTLEVIDTGNATYNIKLYIDKNLSNTTLDGAICGFVLDELQTMPLCNYWNFEPLEIEIPRTLGFKGKESLGSGRGYIWSRSLPLLADTLLLGVGPDMYMLAFPQHDFWGKLNYFSAPYTCVDKPHNTYLQFWINQGALACIAFLVICITYIIHCLLLYAFKKYYTPHEWIGLGFMTSIIAYLCTSFFNDTTLSVTPLFFALLGAGMAYNVIYQKTSKSI